MFSPDFNTFDALSRHGKLTPVYMKVPGDLETPLSAFMKIDDGKASFLLESVEGGSRWARYSLLGSDPRAVIALRGGAAEVTENGLTNHINGYRDAADCIKSVMADYSLAKPLDCPEFLGGAIGYLAYDVVRGFERLPDLNRADLGFHEAYFMVTRDVVVFDNLLHNFILCTCVRSEEFTSTRAAYTHACYRLQALRDKLAGPIPVSTQENSIPAQEFTSNLNQSEFEGMVRTAKDHITSGDIIQVVLSQRFGARTTANPLNVYRGLRMINPSPYMFFIRAGDEALAGSSPEVMVRLRDGEATLRPIAGTRPRGANREQDEALASELLADPKEVAEHVMLVDLARNDLGRIAAPGTVEVDAFKIVERYSHVMHMVSNVKAKMLPTHDAYDVLRATFPAGTLSGAPKIRAMEIIEALEPEHRGPYGGCVGYFSFSGEMDMGITIRTVMMKQDRMYFQAGAGIVADSVPELEYLETIKKAEAMKRALSMAQTFPGRLS